MSKSQKNQDSRGRFGRGIAALSLAATLVASTACTTNQTRGEGEPVRVTPAVGPMAPSSTPGTSTGMVSSSSEAIRVMKERAAYDGRYLGPANPGTADGATATVVGTYSAPAPLAGGQQLTVNSSISSPYGVPAIVSGADGGGGAAIVAGVSSPAVTSSATSNAVTASSVSPGLASVGANGFTSSSGVTGGITAAQTSVPTATSTATPVLSGGIFTGVSSTVSATPLANTTSNVQSAGATGTLLSGGVNAGTAVPVTTLTAGTAGTTVAPATTTAATTATAGTSVTASSTSRSTGKASGKIATPVRIVRSTNGSVTVTNASSGKQ